MSDHQESLKQQFAMKYFALIFILFTLNLNAQNVLKFDKKNVQCEDKWIAHQMEKDSTYIYGFIYIDPEAGLTFDYGGKFKINASGKFMKQPEESTSSLKVRLSPNRILIAEIPESKFAELGVEQFPTWLENYKTGEDSAKSLYKKGYRYNEWGEYQKALISLEKADKIDPNYEGLQTEMAYSYNALEEFEKAEKALEKALAVTPNDCYTLKELAYTYKHMKLLEKSAEVYNKMALVCKNKNSVQETAYNLAGEYYRLKDKKNFKKWSKEARKWTGENKYTQSLDLMEKEL